MHVAVAVGEELAVKVSVAVSDGGAPGEGVLVAEVPEVVVGVEGAVPVGLWDGEGVEVTVGVHVRTCACACTWARAARRRAARRDAADGIVLLWVWGGE